MLRHGYLHGSLCFHRNFKLTALDEHTRMHVFMLRRICIRGPLRFTFLFGIEFLFSVVVFFSRQHYRSVAFLN